VMILVLASPGLARADGEFETAAIHIERNVMDNDAEVIFEATAGGAGLAMLNVVAPDGRTVISFKAPESRLGVRHLSLETPEPKNDGRLLADFPAGKYRFSGSTVNGGKLHGQAVLSHRFPEVASLAHPTPDERDVPVTGLVVRWNAVSDLAAYTIVIEQEETGQEIKLSLPGTTTAFPVPDGLLAPGREYKLGLGTVSKEGNTSFVEVDFTTAAKQ
jgi:hypothetical protein